MNHTYNIFCSYGQCNRRPIPHASSYKHLRGVYWTQISHKNYGVLSRHWSCAMKSRLCETHTTIPNCYYCYQTQNATSFIFNSYPTATIPKMPYLLSPFLVCSRLGQAPILRQLAGEGLPKAPVAGEAHLAGDSNKHSAFICCVHDSLRR